MEVLFIGWKHYRVLQEYIITITILLNITREFEIDKKRPWIAWNTVGTDCKKQGTVKAFTVENHMIQPISELALMADWRTRQQDKILRKSSKAAHSMLIWIKQQSYYHHCHCLSLTTALWLWKRISLCWRNRPQSIQAFKGIISTNNSTQGKYVYKHGQQGTKQLQ